MTHLLTKVGIVRTDCNKQIMYSIILLENHLNQLVENMQESAEFGMGALLPSFKEEANSVAQQISDLTGCLNDNIAQLIK